MVNIDQILEQNAVSLIDIISNRFTISMVQPIQQILQLKSLSDLRGYLQERPKLNLSIINDRNKCSLVHHAAFKNDFQRMKLYIQHFQAFCDYSQGKTMNRSSNTFHNQLRAWVNSANTQGCIPIHFAALHGNIQMIKMLEQVGSNLQYKTNDGQNILFMCAQKNQLATFIYLNQQSKRLDLTELNNKGQNLLHYAAKEGFSDFLAYLLTLDIPYNHQNIDGSTPLMEAVRQSNKEVVKRLLIKGVNRHLKDKNDMTAMQIAEQRNNTQMVSILNDQFTALQKFKISCNKKMVYAPQAPSLAYVLLFLVLFNVIYTPTNILCEIQIGKIPSILTQASFYLIVLIDYLLLLRKPKKKPKQNPLTIKLPMCAECRVSLIKNSYHCHICSQCIYRYDHHCPWINGCVGAHNIGKFALLLFLLIIGLVYIITCTICLLGGWLDVVFGYRDLGIEINHSILVAVHALTLFLSLIIIPIILLFRDQIQNLATNTTGFERRRSNQKKKSSLIASDALNQSNDSIGTDQQEEEGGCSCLTNCKDMISDKQ